ncbi:MAG: type IV pilin-like G/H family protein [Cyanobacteriota bacterium]|nr:type IV pilin-like G/H family protein [Cyanobacteriota bacterium]
MQNLPQTANYRTLLAQRGGRRFSEPEVMEMLRQVLLQLAQLHRQGQAHGAISLETLWQTENRIAVAAPLQPADASFIPRDLYDVGMAAIALLTAQPPTVWQNSGGSSSWDDYCTVSDRLLDAIDRLVGIAPNRFNSADEVLGAIAPSPPPMYTAPQENDPVSQGVDSPSPVRKQAILIGGSFASLAILILYGLETVSLLGQEDRVKEAEAKNIIGFVNRSQQVAHLDGAFVSTVPDLRPSTIYDYQISIPSSDRAIITATPKQKKLRSYTGIVFVYSRGRESLAIGAICESLKPSLVPPETPEIVGDRVQCPPGSRSLGDSDRSSHVPAPENTARVASASPDNRAAEIPPEQIVRDYYSNINSRQYRIAWESLPAEMQNNAKLHPKGISSFTSWWDTVERVNVRQTDAVTQRDREAVVDIDLEYMMEKGNVSPQSLRFLLVKNPTTERWRIEEIRLIDSSTQSTSNRDLTAVTRPTSSNLVPVPDRFIG